MATEFAVALPLPTSSGRSPRTVVARLAAKRAGRSGALWGCLFGAVVASTALGYASTYSTVAQRDRLATTFGSNAATAALVGRGVGLQTVAGFTVWKSLISVAVIAGVWGLFTGTRLLRGEEDAGRWECLLAGQTTRRRATAQALAGMTAGAAALFTVTAVITVLIGRSAKVRFGVGSSLYFAFALVATGAMFLAVGALTSQLGATRRRASAYAGAALGVSYALRMVADSGVSLGWLRSVSPLGWVEEMRPLVAPDPWAIVPIAGFTIVTAVLAVYLAGVRDLGAATFPDRPSGPPHTRLLSNALGLTVRLERSTVIGWTVAIATTALMLGVIAKSSGAAISGASSVERAFARLGARGTGTDAYLGIAFLIVAVLVVVIGAGQVSAARTEEAEGRLVHLLVRPVSRRSWLGGRVVVAAAMLVGSGALAGVCTWIGATADNAGVSFSRVFEAGINVVPPGLCIFGIGVLALGISPRATAIATYGFMAWSLLVTLIGSSVTSNHWLLDTSVFHQMSAAPAVPPNWVAAGVMTAVAAVAVALGAVAFARRDLRGE